MNKKEQREFVKVLIKGITATIINRSKNFPEDWGAGELRHYVKERFADVVWRDHLDERSEQYKKYYKDCLKYNL